jgi:hypothetical protein
MDGLISPGAICILESLSFPFDSTSRKNLLKLKPKQMTHPARILLSTALIIHLGSTGASAQSKLQGIVTKDKDQPLAEATVLLLNAKDSSLVKGSLTAGKGNYAFEKVAPGNYIIAASFTGYKQAYSPLLQVGENEQKTVGAVSLSEKSGSLDAVTVTARKPLYEQKVDRMVINVASNITSAGSTVLDVLERSPGVAVDRQNNSLSINGKNGVVVMINGRINHMPISALVQMLASMPSDNVEKMELITTPPANFDAEGNAGYINLVLKKNTQYGTNGSYSVTQGWSKGSITEAAGNINHREAKWNLYSNYSFSRVASSQTLKLSHASWNGPTYFENVSTSERSPVEIQSDLKVGFDYDIKKNLVAGVLVDLFNRGWDMDAVNEGTLYANGKPDTLSKLVTSEKHPLNSFDINANVQKNFTDGKLAFNLDYMNYRESNPVDYLNSYYDGNGAFLYDQQLRSGKNTPVKLWVAAIDLDRRLSKKVNLSAGVKATFSSFTNAVSVERLATGGWTEDASLTATDFLDENISAAYSTMDWQVSEKTSMKAGLRYEYTNSNLRTETQKDLVDRHYGKLFPSFFLSHALKDNNSWSFAYSRRISRPSFWDLAPFVIFMDPNTFFSGNPALQPSITDNLNTSLTLKRKIVSLSYSYQANPITNFAPHIDSTTNVETLSAENQDHSISYNVNFSLPFDIAKWWSVQVSLNGGYMKMHGLYNKEPVILQQETFSGNVIQNFKLPKDYTFSISGFYSSGGLFGIYKAQSLGSLDLGFQKKFKNQKSSLRLNFSNVLNSQVYRISVNEPEKNLVAAGELHFSHPAARLTFTHNFGSDKVKAKRERSTATEEEKDRLKM